MSAELLSASPEGREVVPTSLKAMTYLGLNPSEVIYVGDTTQDFEAARNAGVTCVVVSDKNASEAVAGAQYLIKNINELPALVTLAKGTQNS